MAKLKVQGNASGTGVVTLTAPNTNTDRTITLPDGDITLGGGVDGIVSTANATAITIDANENVGIGVVPESGTSSTHTSLAIGETGTLTGRDTVAQVALANNAYVSGADFNTAKYIKTDEASMYAQHNAGEHRFLVAPSGTADSAISWTTAMTIDNAGRVTMPYQPRFWASRTTDTGSGLQGGFSASINVGGHFNGQRFTAPVAGIYEFYWQSIGAVGTNATSDVYIYKNGAKNANILSARPDAPGGTYSDLCNAKGVVSLGVNDYIEISASVGIYSDSNYWHKFGGHLIG